jgi:hypothetical protein
MIVNSFNVKDTQDLFDDEVNADAIAAADLEFGMIMTGQGDKITVTMGMDHKTHTDRHNEQMGQLNQMVQQEQAQPQPAAPPQMGGEAGQFQMDAPQQPQAGPAAQALQQLQQHIELHGQALEQGSAQFGAPTGGQAKPEGPTDIASAVRSAGQMFGQASKAQAKAASGK